MRYLLVPVLIVGLGVLAACTEAGAPPAGAAGGAQEVTVEMTEFAFSPAEITVNAGQPVRLTLRNAGAVTHDWVVELDSQTVSLEAEPGQQASTTFTPQTSGIYTVICTEPGHEQGGMVGTLIVN